MLRNIILAALILSSFALIITDKAEASSGETIQVSTSRYSVYNPWLINSNYSFNLSGNFTAFALLLNNGVPVNGTNITFEIYANGTQKATLYNLTQQNGLASVSYNTIGQFTDRNDTDYGNWTITAYNTSNSTVTGSTNMSLEGWQNTNVTTCGSRDSLCHKITIIGTGSNNGTGGNYPHSPYTGGYGNDSTFAEAAHKRSTHSSNSYRGCYICHPGYSVNKTGNYGSTNDVHRNRTCDFCHGNWTYIRNNLTDPYPGGQGIPLIPSCYGCHPINNSNLTSISILADLTPGANPNVTGENISVYSYNFDTGAPLTAHNGTDYSLIASVPCIVCHGPAHNTSKPDPALANTNDITETSQCITCHGPRHGGETSCTGCHSQDAHAITKPAGLDNCNLCHSSYGSAVNSSRHNQTINSSAPNCTDCHADYNLTDSGHTGLIVNESNTCTVTCHINGTAQLTERHSSTSDCTKCHFANTTQVFGLNASLFTHDHNLTVERNFYNYNLSGGIPLISNNGTGLGMFPYYSCQIPCHGAYGSLTSTTDLNLEMAARSWNESAHARSRHGNETYDSKNSCAKCKSPPNYNASASSGTAIAEADWQGIQCRVCHNIHNRKVSDSIGGGPLAYYNSTSSSQAGYPVYEAVANATVLCENCHTGSSHDSKFAGYHKENLSFTCVSCHANSTFNNQTHKFEVKNTTSGVTGCEVCHETADHTWSFTSIHTDNATCEACHDQTFVVNATNFSVLINGISSYDKGLYKNSTTNKWTTYKVSSNAPATWQLHNISRSVNCSKCHNAYSPFNGTTRGDTLIAGSISSSIRNCIGCHDIGGLATKEVNFSALNGSNSVHRTLNYNTSTAVSTSNSRCWGCHGDGDGSESAQPTNDHPSNYNTPKNCNNNNCHSISQSRYNETMVYSHFRNASRNDNPGNITSYNITTVEPCENCHVNSLVTEGSNPNLALASHYASKTKLIDSFNCTYCHTDEDNSEKWGNATLISKNRTSLIEFERVRNKLMAFEGETVYLGEGYYLKVLEISVGRENVLLQLLYNGSVVDEILLGANTLYEYKKKVLINSSISEIPFITLNISSIMKGDKNGFIQFSGSRIKKNHTDRESKNPACYACHMYRSSEEKERYQVIDKEYKTDADDIIYYTKVLTDFNSENRSKVYFGDEDYIFDQLENQPGKFLNTISRQKYLMEGETWNISDDYSLKLKEVSTDSNLSWLTLSIDGSVVKDDVAGIGSAYIYSPEIKYKDTTGTDVTIFTANITAVFQGRPNFILLKDVVALSPQILKVTSNDTLFGYNNSWFRINDTFTVGRIPANLHAPNLREDTMNWADCAMCHNASKKLRIPGIENISTGLGKHSILNIAASNKASLSDSIDKACWACHTEGAEPQTHSPTHITPRYCTSCHIDRKEPFYGASDINNGTHKFKSDCEVCHIRGSHNLVKPAGFSVISEITLPQSVKKGETINLTAKANAGYGMKVRSAEYFIDTRGTSGKGKLLKAVDGAFDSQIEQMAAEINTADIPAGGHVIYIHAMGTDNKWGGFYSANFSIVSGEGSGSKAVESARSFLKSIPGLDMIFILLSLVAVYFIILGIRRR